MLKELIETAGRLESLGITGLAFLGLAGSIWVIKFLYKEDKETKAKNEQLWEKILEAREKENEYLRSKIK